MPCLVSFMRQFVLELGSQRFRLQPSTWAGWPLLGLVLGRRLVPVHPETVDVRVVRFWMFLDVFGMSPRLTSGNSWCFCYRQVTSSMFLPFFLKTCGSHWHTQQERNPDLPKTPMALASVARTWVRYLVNSTRRHRDLGPEKCRFQS